MKKAALFTAISALVVMAAAPGIRPGAGATNYSGLADFTIGAFLIPPDQVKKMSKTDLNHAVYVAIEVGVFPTPGKDIDLDPTDFTLSVGENSAALRPVSADTIAEHVAGPPEPPHPRGPFHVNTSTGIYIGHRSYPDTDSSTGRKGDRTVTGTEVGVGVGGPAPRPCRGYDCEPTAPLPPPAQPSPAENVNAVLQDLWEKSLPDGKAAHRQPGICISRERRERPTHSLGVAI